MAPKRTEVPIIFDGFRIISFIVILLHCASVLSSRDTSLLWSHSNIPASIKTQPWSDFVISVLLWEKAEMSTDNIFIINKASIKQNLLVKQEPNTSCP